MREFKHLRVAQHAMHVHTRVPDRQLPTLTERDVGDRAHQSQHVLARLRDFSMVSI